MGRGNRTGPSDILSNIIPIRISLGTSQGLRGERPATNCKGASNPTSDVSREYMMQSSVHPITGHESTEGEYRYTSTLSLTSALDGGGWSTPRPGRFTPGKDPVPIV